jgi:hypothetical protein
MSGLQPTFTELLDWLEGRLDDARSADVADRVEHGDRATGEAVAWIRSFLEAAGSMPLQAPPPEVRSAVRGLIDEQLAPWAEGEYRDAVRAYDSRTVRATGTRAGPPAEPGEDGDVQHLIFDTDFGQIVLDVIIADNMVDLRGSVPQVLVDLVGGGSTRVVLTSDRAVRRTTVCSPDGLFTIFDVPSGIDEMWVEHGGTRIRAAVDLPARA